MKTLSMIWLAAAGALTLAGGANAQNASSYTPGQYWEVSEIDVQDGQDENYLDYLAGQWKRSQEFAKSKGYIRGYHVLTNSYARDGEPDLYLITVSDSLPDPKEQARRQTEFEAFMQRNAHLLSEESGKRGTMRRLKGSMLLQELNLK
jgi:hypothetical protein